MESLVEAFTVTTFSAVTLHMNIAITTSTYKYNVYKPSGQVKPFSYHKSVHRRKRYVHNPPTFSA